MVFAGSPGSAGGFERFAFLGPHRTRPTGFGVACDKHRLRLSREFAAVRANLLPGCHARGPDPGESAADENRVVVEAELTPEVDRDACDHEVARSRVVADRVLKPLVTTLLEIRQVDRVVDVVVRVDVVPSDLDPLLVHAWRS